MDDRFRFRAWDREKKVMVYLDIGTEKSVAVSRLHVALLSDYLREQWGVVMQSTGLKDKNGRLTWERDNIKTPLFMMGRQNGYEIHAVIFKNGCFGVQRREYDFVPLFELLESVTTKYVSNVGEVATETRPLWEVIGNVYENPALVEAE